jgi:hypothetical protein
MKKALLFCCIPMLFRAAPLKAQDPSPDWTESRFEARFQPLDWLIGEWQGYGEFSDRTTYIHKRFSYEVAGVYLVERTVDVFPPPQPSTEFELHQDLSVLYRDNQTGEFTANTFFVETFVTDGAVRIGDDGNSFVVESERIHNGPPGMRTRITYSREGPDQFRLLFEIGMAGEEYRQVEEAHSSRIKRP